MKSLFCTLIAFSLTGCALCEQRPEVCAVAVGIVATSIVLSASHHHAENGADSANKPHSVNNQPITCTTCSE